jgi:hypothetical protein
MKPDFEERCDCGGKLIFNDEYGTAICDSCSSYERYFVNSEIMVDKLGVPFWSCPGCGKQWIKTQRNYCPRCRFGMESAA